MPPRTRALVLYATRHERAHMSPSLSPYWAGDPCSIDLRMTRREGIGTQVSDSAHLSFLELEIDSEKFGAEPVASGCGVHHLSSIPHSRQNRLTDSRLD